jgi:hypothetical protein
MWRRIDVMGDVTTVLAGGNAASRTVLVAMMTIPRIEVVVVVVVIVVIVVVPITVVG